MKKPQVLVIGNGMNRAFGCDSWNNFIKDIAKETSGRTDLPDEMKAPMPMQAIIASKDALDCYFNGEKKGAVSTGKEKQEGRREKFYGFIKDEAQAKVVSGILGVGANHIITTNYSYELEMVTRPDYRITDQYLKKMMRCTKGNGSARAEARYLIHTYNEVQFQGKKTPIWHIHGEARKPNSMIMGHYYYGSLLTKIKEYSDRNCSRFSDKYRKNTAIEINSWIDAFILGDVYFLGIGMDMSELDLWWLINRKKREKAPTGNIYYFEPSSGEAAFNEKYELFRAMEKEGMKVEIRDCGVTINGKTDDEKNRQYQLFYQKAADEIKSIISNNTNSMKE